jgi:4-amino-4-deoxy-L-arabinose transferase-like glycosyltransferase
LILVWAVITLHAVFVITAGAYRLTFLSGGSDAPAYSLLASNLLHHRGFTYAGQPTALRPPGYPLLLAAMYILFGKWYVLVTRWMQFFICIGTAWLCGRSAKLLFDDEAGRAAFILTLLVPTQVFASAQILTECLASFLFALFLYCLVCELTYPATRTELGMGVAAGIGSLIRFNTAALPLFAGLAIIRYRGRRRWIAVASTMILPFLFVLPWLVRNLVVFDHHVLFSTQDGYNALQGVLTPQGRTQVGDSDKILRAVGWEESEIETNDSSRLAFPSESALNRRCWKAVPGFWRERGWQAVPFLAGKISDFWLSTDQLLDTKSLSLSSKLIRFFGVAMYWVILALAVLGWRRLHRTWPRAANILLAYAVIFTVLHLPLIMNTRYRFPLMDAPMAALAGGGLFSLRFFQTLRQRLWTRSE